MAQVKLNLSRSIPNQIDQGHTAFTMSSAVMTGTEPLVTALGTANADLEAKQAAAIEARQGMSQAFAAMRESARQQRLAFANLGSLVQTKSLGNESYILSCGYGVRASNAPLPPIEDAPSDLRTRINGTPGRILFSWKGVIGARNYEVQYTTDLSGASGWTSAVEMPGATRLAVDGLTSGTKYALRVRACGNAIPGPWSTPVQQMAP